MMLKEKSRGRIAGGQIQFKNNHPHQRQVQFSEDEIDLGQLLIKICLFIKRHFKLMVFSIAFGLTVGVIFFLLHPPFYKSDIVFSSSILEKKTLAELITKLDRYIVEENSSIQSQFDFNRILNVTLQESEDNSSSHIISVIVTDPNYLTEFQKSLLQYINSNPYVNEIILAEKKRINKTLEILNREEVNIEEMLKRISEPNNTQLEIAEILKLKMNLQKEKIALTNELESLAAISVIQGFPIYEKPINKNMMLILLIVTAASLALALLYASFFELYKFLNKQEQIKELQEVGYRFHAIRGIGKSFE